MAYSGPFTVYDVMSLLNIPYKPNAPSVAVPCPVCNSVKPKLHININEGMFHCFACDVSGGVLDLYSIYRGDIPKDKAARRESYNEICERLMIPDEVAKKAERDVISSNIKKPVHFETSDEDVRNQTYQTLLSICGLSKNHLNKLLKRGIDLDFIKERGYKTAPRVLNDDIVSAIMERGNIVRGVPGFYMDTNQNWHMSPPKKGLFVPVRDINNRIQGLQNRLDITTDRKFNWFSSSYVADGCRGCGANAWYHFVGDPECRVLIVTEGPMKADVIHYFTGMSVAAVPGVNNLNCMMQLLAELKKRNLQTVLLAYDMDLFANWHVDQAYKKLTAYLEQMGLWYYHLLWNPAKKGLDDFLRHVSVNEGIENLDKIVQQLNQIEYAL